MNQTFSLPGIQRSDDPVTSGQNPFRDLAILNAVAKNKHLTQRQLAREVGIAVSLANQSLHRLIRAGLVQAIRIHSRRLRYLLTPEGVDCRIRLSRVQMCGALAQYREIRKALFPVLEPLVRSGRRRIALYGCGEGAELVYLFLREHDLSLSVVFDVLGGSRFLGHPVHGFAELSPEDFDSIVLTLTDDGEQVAGIVEALVSRGVSPECIVALCAEGEPPEGRVADPARQPVDDYSPAPVP